MRGSRLVYCSRICSVESDLTSQHNFGKNVSSPLLQPGSTSLYTLEIKSVHQLSIYLPLFCLCIFKMLEEVWFLRLIKNVFGYNITSLWKCQIYFPLRVFIGATDSETRLPLLKSWLLHQIDVRPLVIYLIPLCLDLITYKMEIIRIAVIHLDFMHIKQINTHKTLSIWDKLNAVIVFAKKILITLSNSFSVAIVNMYEVKEIKPDICIARI